MKLLKIFILLILLLFPFGELLRFDIGNNIAIKIFDVVIGLMDIWFITYLLVKTKTTKFKGKKSFLLLPMAVFVLIAVISLLLNYSWLKPNEFFASLLYFLRWVAYAGVFFVVSQFDEKFKKIIGVFLLIDGAAIVLFGYLQYFFYNSLKNLFYLGWDEHMHRIFSTFFDPNFAGAFFVLFFIFVGGIIYSRLQEKKRKGMYLLYFIFLATLIATFLTYSRSALLMLIAGSIVFLTMIGKKKMIFFLMGAVLLFGIIISPKFYDENMNLFRMTSTEGRISNYLQALSIIKERPILGVGFNSYRYAKQFYGMRSSWILFPSHADAGVDNSFLFVLATTGLVGLGAYLFLWFTLLKKAFLFYKEKFDVSILVMVSSTLALFVDAFFINSLFFMQIMLWMWIVIGLMKER